jgi:hypothetical protein
MIAGNSIGASRATEAGLHLVAFSLVTINAYHLSNFLVSKLTTHDSSWFFIGLLYLVGIGIACLEIPIGKSLITAYRLDKFSMSTVIQAMLALVIVSMAVVAGINSQASDADKRETQVNAYSQTDSNYSNMRLSAELTRDSAILRASLINDVNSRAIALIEAKKNYQDSVVLINNQQAKNTLHKPIETFENGSLMQTITMGLFSVVCSLGAMFVSAFSATFISPLVALPAFSLMAKKNHEWDSDGSDFKAMKHGLSPLGKVAGLLNKEKIPAKILNLTSDSEVTTKERPTPAPTMPNTDLINSNTASVRTPKQDYTKAHYEVVKQGIISGVIKPTIKPVKNELERLNIKFVSDAARQSKAVEILEQLKVDGVLMDNPEFGKSKKILAKLVLNPDFEKAKNHPFNSSVEEVGGDNNSASKKGTPFESVCPSCKATVLIDKTSKQGLVRCECDHVFNADENRAVS